MYNRDLHHRRSIRLPDVDYTEPGSFFVTICTAGKVCLFGEVVEEVVRNDFGQVAEACWLEIPEHIPHVELDAFIIMPNHVHGIIGIVAQVPDEVCSLPHGDRGRGTACRAPTRRFADAQPGSLPTIIGAYKSAVTRRINVLRGTSGAPVWQRNYTSSATGETWNASGGTSRKTRRGGRATGIVRFRDESKPALIGIVAHRPICHLGHQNMKYKVSLRKTEEGYSVSCPGLPGCWSQGDTEEEALSNIAEAIQEYLVVAEEMAGEKGSELREVDIAA
jgi:putative transposase